QTFVTIGGPHVVTEDRDAGHDVLEFGPGITPADVVLLRQGDNLLVGLRDPAAPDAPFEQLADRLTVRDFFKDNNRIETLRFADGTTLAPEELGIGQFVATAVDAGERVVTAAGHPNGAEALHAASAAAVAALGGLSGEQEALLNLGAQPAGAPAPVRPRFSGARVCRRCQIWHRHVRRLSHRIQAAQGNAGIRTWKREAAGAWSSAARGDVRRTLRCVSPIVQQLIKNTIF
ncbi:calcium-binding protein, partial [Azospirillum sp. TSO22-1]|uniref:calcium-binding protein n=1 Tax=Azospirillum sp. TSO22-1 TaxID=716789 RepID=UPI000D60D851